jgi:hypothetical protein
MYTILHMSSLAYQSANLASMFVLMSVSACKNGVRVSGLVCKTTCIYVGTIYANY